MEAGETLYEVAETSDQPPLMCIPKIEDGRQILF
jgi:hypothetical protein